eukprot:6969398-Pyramimonas_sp.AAC.1
MEKCSGGRQCPSHWRIYSIPFRARHFEYSTEYSTYIPCRRTAVGWIRLDESDDVRGNDTFVPNTSGAVEGEKMHANMRASALR